MIARTIIRRALSLRSLAAPTASLLSTPRFNFSRKIQKAAPPSFKTLLQDQIKAEQTNLNDLSVREDEFKTKGWTISRDNTIIELAKDTGKYRIKLLSNIKSPANFPEEEQNKQQQPNEEEPYNGDNMSEITILITKIGQQKTMIVNTVTSESFQITNVTFADSEAAAKKQRSQIFISNVYSGPELETVSDELFEAIYGFLEQECQVSNELLTSLAGYCVESEQEFYIGWLKDLKSIV